MHHNGQHGSWACDVRNTLSKYGFRFVWDNQGVQNINGFLKVYKQRLVECFRQDWHGHLESSDRFTVYRIFKLDHSPEPYFACVPSNGLRKLLIRFRLGISDLLIHKTRYQANGARTDCPLCKYPSDNEMHFLFQCEYFADLREKYIPNKYCIFPCHAKLSSLMTDKDNMNNLALYIFHCMKRRKILG